MTRRELTEAIKSKALEIGFTKAGVTSAEPFDTAADLFEEWLASGSHGTMLWLDKSHEKRRDVRNILPSAKSILSLALNYYNSGHAAQNTQNKISRYAWGTDYHEVVPAMLKELLEEIKILSPGTEGRYYCDTGPLLEKAIAQRAGVGWIGKHTTLITREVGSWVFLAEIILDVELEPDAPTTDMCGTCTRCIDACPTQAISAPFVLDSNRCISYLTIELKPEHEIAGDVASNMEDWLYGCDICQDICPWNRFSEETNIAEFAPRAENLSMSNEAIEQMEPDEFAQRFRKSPIKRTKLAGLKRNVRARSAS